MTESTPHPLANAPAVEELEAPRYRRRRWWIDSELQGAYLLHMLGVSCVVGLAAVLLTSHYWLGSEGAQEPLLHLRGHLLHLGLAMLGATLLIAPVTCVLLSHRVAGPAYRLRDAARRLAAGEWGCRIHLRRHDHLKPTAESINELAAKLAGRARDEAARREVACALIDRALTAAEEHDPAAMDKARSALREARRELTRD